MTIQVGLTDCTAHLLWSHDCSNHIRRQVLAPPPL
jgi:hypothetical protein